VGTGEDGLDGIELRQQLLDGLIVSCLDEMVEANGQSVGGEVGSASVSKIWT
jgi:hypothetical protein